MHWMVIGAWWVRFNRCQCAYVYVYVSGCLRRFVVDVLKIDFQMRKAANFIQKLISVDKCHTISCSHKNYYYKLWHCTQCRIEFRSISYVTDWRFTPTNFVFGVPHFFLFFWLLLVLWSKDCSFRAVLFRYRSDIKTSGILSTLWTMGNAAKFREKNAPNSIIELNRQQPN